MGSITGNLIGLRTGNVLFARGHGRENKEMEELVMFKEERKQCSETKKRIFFDNRYEHTFFIDDFL